MPTYDYRCTACDHTFEHFQSISSPLLRKCPECGKAKLERLIGAGGGLLFKGSGFYITDYRSSSYHDAAKQDAAPGSASKGDASAPASKDSSKGEAKSEKGGGKPAETAKPKPASSPAPSRSKKGRS